ncbi:MAG TPA: hypothetical protein VLN47_03070, partial [Clostridiaceae bacterium]|nr:hypothetical protein [Clostridiaceae bacterium]
RRWRQAAGGHKSPGNTHGIETTSSPAKTKRDRQEHRQVHRHRYRQKRNRIPLTLDFMREGASVPF